MLRARGCHSHGNNFRRKLKTWEISIWAFGFGCCLEDFALCVGWLNERRGGEVDWSGSWTLGNSVNFIAEVDITEIFLIVVTVASCPHVHLVHCTSYPNSVKPLGAKRNGLCSHILSPIRWCEEKQILQAGAFVKKMMQTAQACMYWSCPIRPLRSTQKWVNSFKKWVYSKMSKLCWDGHDDKWSKSTWIC